MADADILNAPIEPLAGVTLSPPQEADREAIRAAADSEETSRWSGYRADGPHFDSFWSPFWNHHKPLQEIRWIVRHNGVVVGATSFLDVQLRQKRLEIGGTWYRADMREMLAHGPPS